MSGRSDHYPRYSIKRVFGRRPRWLKRWFWQRQRSLDRAALYDDEEPYLRHYDDYMWT